MRVEEASSAPDRISSVTPSWLRVLFAREIRCATVASVVGKARRSRALVSPPIILRVNEIRAEGGESRMARGEDQAEEVVVDVLQGRVEVALGQLGHSQLLQVSDLLQLAREVDVAADAVDSPASRRRGEPRTGLWGMPSRVHCSRACHGRVLARCSARPTSPTRRATTAVTLAASMRQTASSVSATSSARAMVRDAPPLSHAPSPRHTRQQSTSYGCNRPVLTVSGCVR